MVQTKKEVKNTIIGERENKKLVLVLQRSLSIFELGVNIEDYLHLNPVCIPKEELEVYSDTYDFPNYGVSLSMDEKTEKNIRYKN